LHRLWDNSEKCGEERGAINNVSIWRARVAYWISRTTWTYSHAHAHAPEYLHACTHARTHEHNDQKVTLIAFPRQQWFANAP
jgi:hypothetical protein